MEKEEMREEINKARGDLAQAISDHTQAAKVQALANSAFESTGVKVSVAIRAFERALMGLEKAS